MNNEIWRDVVADLAAIVRVQNGNLHADINELLDRAKAVLATQPPQDERCPVCGEDEPFTGTCGAGDKTNAFCKRPPAEPAQPVALSTLTDGESFDRAERVFWLVFDSVAKKHKGLKSVLLGDMIALIEAVLAASAPAQQATPPQPVAAEVEKDTQRLDWLAHRLSGAELRRIGVERASGDAYWVRIAIDEAMAGTGSDESAKESGNGL